MRYFTFLWLNLIHASLKTQIDEQVVEFFELDFDVILVKKDPLCHI